MFDLLVAYFGKQVKIANALGTSPQAVHYWKRTGKIPGDRAVQIERVTKGKIKAVDIAREI